MPMALKDVKDALRRGRYTSIGSYPLFFITEDNAVLSFETVREEWRNIVDAHLRQANNGWLLAAVDVNWENDSLYDYHSGAQIESAYGDTDSEQEEID